MPSDCYQVYKDTYNQAKTDGLSDAAAVGAAQTAMAACLSQQNARPNTVAVPFTTVKSGRTTDSGPTLPKQENK